MTPRLFPLPPGRERFRCAAVVGCIAALCLLPGGCSEPTEPKFDFDPRSIEGMFEYRGHYQSPEDSIGGYWRGVVVLPSADDPAPDTFPDPGTFSISPCRHECDVDRRVRGRIENVKTIARDSKYVSISFDFVREGQNAPLVRHHGRGWWREMAGNWVRLDETTGDTVAAGAFLGRFLER